MSTKSSRKNANVTKITNAAIKKKTVQKNQSQIRAKNKKTIKSIISESPKTETQPEIKSTYCDTATCSEDTPLKAKVKQLVQLVEQVEYYPDKLKRDLTEKKIFLKPKPNLKVVASANKRKMAVPKKGGSKSPLPLKKQCTNSQNTEISMVDMVKLIEDTQSLSDEDFMEILTCPSPVWWEDPPHEGYLEDAICTRTPSPCSSENKNQNTTQNEQTDTRISTPVNITDFENVIEQFKITHTTLPEKNNKKKQKLENILGNIKKVKTNQIKIKTPFKINKECENKINKIENKDKIIKGKGEIKNKSNTTDEEDLSDLSFNEEEVLKNLENMNIPIEQSEDQKDVCKKELMTRKNVQAINALNRDVNKNEIKIPEKLPPLKRRPDVKVNKLKDDNLDYNIDGVSHSNFRFISDEDISLVETNNKCDKNMKIVNISSSLGESSSVIDLENVESKNYEIKTEHLENNSESSDVNTEVLPKKTNDLSEYITVYKIMSNDSEKNVNKEKTSKSPETSNNKVDNVSGKLNNFFKKCKSSKRLKKSDVSFPAISVRNNDLKIEKENCGSQSCLEKEENRLKSCDCSDVKIDNGTKKKTSDSCEKAPIFACAWCSFLSNSKDIYKKHISNCKAVARITWKNNLIINTT